MGFTFGSLFAYLDVMEWGEWGYVLEVMGQEPLYRHHRTTATRDLDGNLIR